MFVVLGAGGNTGSVVARTLLEQKQPVRVVVRNPEKGAIWKQRGADVAIASADDAAQLGRAFTGATGVYGLIPPDLTSTAALTRNRIVVDAIANAAQSAKVPHVAFLSSIGAQHESGTGPIQSLHYAEKALRRAGLVATYVRAPYFMENTLPSLELMKTKQILPTFLPADLSMQMVATKDIGLVAAKALLEGAKETTVIELVGPREFTMNEMAAAFGKALKKEITAVVMPLDQVVPTYTSFGISADIAKLFLEMYTAFGQGKVIHEGRGTRFVRGTIDVDAFAASVAV